jgi:hypothetical protein
MSRKSIIMIGMVVGSTAGSCLPALWGGGLFSLSSVLLGGIGGVAGIWLAFQLTR